MAGRAEDGERGHVRAEQRQQEHGRSERTAGEEVLLGGGGAASGAPGEDTDVENGREVEKDDDRRNQRASRSSRCDGQATRVSTHISPAIARQ